MAVLEGGGLPALAALLTAPFESVRQMAVGAVLSVSTEFDAKLAVAEEAGAQLGAMTSDPTPGVALDAVRALQAAAELPAARKHLLVRVFFAFCSPDAACCDCVSSLVILFTCCSLSRLCLCPFPTPPDRCCRRPLTVHSLCLPTHLPTPRNASTQ